MERVKKPRRGGSVSARQSAAAASQDSVADHKVEAETPPAVASEAPAKSADELADEQAGLLVQGAPLVPRDLTLTVKLSRQLHTKLLRSAQEEGVPLESLVQELLAEGATLRAWEIIERKQAMRGQQNPQSQTGNNNQRHFNGQFGNSRHPSGPRAGANNGGRPAGGHGHGRGNGNNRVPTGTAWMDDKAAFLEYVRNQEKRRR